MHAANQDWTEPGTEEVAPGIHRIPLELPTDGLRAVNVYAVEDGDHLAMIDSGWALEGAPRQLADALRPLGAALGDVSRFLVTHIHRDHYTQALAVRKAYGTVVGLGAGEQPSFEALRSAREVQFHPQRSRLLRAGAKAIIDRLAELAGDPPYEDAGLESPDEWLADGATVELATRTLDVVETPGHTRGHVVFRDREAGLLFAGDHVLPHITPSIGLEPAPPAQPLRDFLGSLRKVRALPDMRLLPAHGPVTESSHRRIDELLDHHDQRLQVMAGALREGASTAFEVARMVTWTRRERTLDELDPFNQMLAVLETAAHLDLLALRGEVRTETIDGAEHYDIG